MPKTYARGVTAAGAHEPTTVSVVEVGTMTEFAQLRTCTMLHGSRLSPDGTRHYSGCMMDDELVEIDLASLAVARRLALGPACTPRTRRRVAVLADVGSAVAGWAVRIRPLQ